MWRLGISSSLYVGDVASGSLGGRIEAGGGASQGAGCERGKRSCPSPQPTSRTLMEQVLMNDTK